MPKIKVRGFIIFNASDDELSPNIRCDIYWNNSPFDNPSDLKFPKMDNDRHSTNKVVDITLALSKAAA